MDREAVYSPASHELHSIRRALLRCRRRIGAWLRTHGKGCDCQFCADPGMPGTVATDLTVLRWTIGHIANFIECECVDPVQRHGYLKRLAELAEELDAEGGDDDEPDAATIVDPNS